jgi:hypothetical protein
VVDPAEHEHRRDVQETHTEENIEMRSKSRTPQGPMLVPTTIVLRNFAETVDRTYLCYLLDSTGFYGHYDFLFVPISRKTGKHKGLAYINFTTHAAATSAMLKLSYWFQVSWNQACQGLRALVENYQNSPLMSQDTPNACKPIFLLNGQPVDLTDHLGGF